MHAAQHGPPSYLLFQIPKDDIVQQIFNIKNKIKNAYYFVIQINSQLIDRTQQKRYTKYNQIENILIKQKYCEQQLNSVLLNKNQFSNIRADSQMLLDNYDPNSVKLYSKCARNQASKFSAKKRPYSSNKPYTSLIVCSQSEKRKKVVCTFDMSQSRQQREKKDRKTMTPAVGHYNPKVQSKIKLTWDILKIYHNKNHRIKQRNSINNPQKQQAMSQQQEQPTALVTQVHQQRNVHQNTNEAQQTIENHQDHENDSNEKGYYFQRRNSHNKKIKWESSRYKTIKSQVDMSRMTGRIDEKQKTMVDECRDSQDIDLSKSIEYVKSKPSLNVQFQRQLSRQKVNNLNKPMVAPSDYTYDYGIVKPKNSKVVPFGKSVGRDESKNKDGQQLTYSYTHYDYDRYVWASKSNVYTNTKTHVSDFKKQTNRVLFKR